VWFNLPHFVLKWAPERKLFASATEPMTGVGYSQESADDAGHIGEEIAVA